MHLNSNIRCYIVCVRSNSFCRIKHNPHHSKNMFFSDMDLPPIDMTERLKEVNRALAEDSTPIECDRVTKLRFRDVIAEFQSPRESGRLIRVLVVMFIKLESIFCWGRERKNTSVSRYHTNLAAIIEAHVNVMMKDSRIGQTIVTVVL